jgi:pyruvate dehydrogenase E2 component (dihydrolipoamide acetyltransferase)
MSAAVGHTIEIGMPRLSDSMEEATVSRWLKRPGDPVTRGDELVEVETDKATVVYEAEQTGVLEEIVVDEGASAVLGAVIARIRVAGAAPSPAAPARRDAAPAAAAALPVVARAAGRGGRARATPVARRLAHELGVALDGVDGSGPGGRIVRADVRGLAPAPRGGGSAAAGAGRGVVTEETHGATQRTIAQRMAESRAHIPEFTIEMEIAMGAARALREELRAGGFDPPPSYNDLVVRAAALALREFPNLNAAYETGKTLRFGRVNVGVAVAGEDALLVPTIRDADAKTIFEIAAETRALAERARDRTVTAADLADGTFTVSNLGMFGVRRFTAVINPPQVAILAVGEVADRPVVADGRLVAGTTMEVALSCDHRVVYGAEAARFLARLRELLEHPTLLIVERRST